MPLYRAWENTHERDRVEHFLYGFLNALICNRAFRVYPVFKCRETQAGKNANQDAHLWISVSPLPEQVGHYWQYLAYLLTDSYARKDFQRAILRYSSSRRWSHRSG